MSSRAYAFYKAHWAAVLLFCDFCLNVVYLLHGPLHPIDYPTYLEQASRITRDGVLDYAEIAGKTGPLVYREDISTAEASVRLYAGFSWRPCLDLYCP